MVVAPDFAERVSGGLADDTIEMKGGIKNDNCKKRQGILPERQNWEVIQCGKRYPLIKCSNKVNRGEFAPLG